MPVRATESHDIWSLGCYILPKSVQNQCVIFTYCNVIQPWLHFHLAFSWNYCWYLSGQLPENGATKQASQSHLSRLSSGKKKKTPDLKSILLFYSATCHFSAPLTSNLCFPLSLKLYKQSVKADGLYIIKAEPWFAKEHLINCHGSPPARISILFYFFFVKEIVYRFWPHLIFTCSTCSVLFMQSFSLSCFHSYKCSNFFLVIYISVWCHGNAWPRPSHSFTYDEIWYFSAGLLLNFPSLNL